MEEKNENEVVVRWTRPNNHGCEGLHYTIRLLLPRMGVVVAVGGCTANGCLTLANMKAREGLIVRLPPEFRGGWEEAAEPFTPPQKKSFSWWGGTRVQPANMFGGGYCLQIADFHEHNIMCTVGGTRPLREGDVEGWRWRNPELDGDPMSSEEQDLVRQIRGCRPDTR